MKIKVDKVKEDLDKTNQKYKKIIEIITNPIVTIGACIWLLDYIMMAGVFSYSTMFIILVVIICLLLARFFAVVPKWIPFDSSIFLLICDVFSILSGLVILFIGLLCFSSWVTGFPPKAYYSHAFFVISDNALFEKDDVPLSAINEAIENDLSGNIDYYADRGELYIKIYDNVLSKGDSKAIYNQSGQLYDFDADDCLSNAVNDYTIALIIKPDNVKYKFGRGKAFRRMGQKYSDSALSDLSTVCKSDPDNEEYLLEYGKILIHRQDFESQKEGLKIISKASEKMTSGKNHSLYYSYLMLALQDLDKKEMKEFELGGYTKILETYAYYGTSENLEEGLNKSKELIKLLEAHPDFTNNIIDEMGKYVFLDRLDMVYEYSVLLCSVGKYEEAVYFINQLINHYPTYLRGYALKDLIQSRCDNSEVLQM